MRKEKNNEYTSNTKPFQPTSAFDWSVTPQTGKRKRVLVSGINTYKNTTISSVHYGFTGMFKKKEEDLIKSSMESMKHWLGIIKQGRIVYKDPNRITDGFSQPGALHKSLNLLELNEDDLE